jgi:hypothetical protein
MYGLKPVPFKDCALLFLELLSTEFAVISVHQRGMEITVNGVCGQFRKSDAQDFILGLDGAFRGSENPLPRTQVRRWHSST